MIGRQLGGYRIESVIGRGGMGIVYLADQTRLDRKVALKVITPELAHDADFRTRFERESRIAASIDHPNVVPVYEAGEEEGLLYIAMRYVRGTDLKALTADGPLDPGRAVGIVGQVASALDAAHASGLVHRDVKPGNILIEEGQGAAGGRAYLSDFGLTKRLSSESGVTKTGFVVGTLDYIAPEQVQGAPIDARTDVYALACVLFHALSGRVPYERENDMAKMYAHANLPAPSLLEAAPGAPRALEDVVRRGMAKEAGERYASAGDLGRAADAALHGAAPTLAERSVAIGAAAPGQETVAEVPVPADPPTAETQPLPPAVPPPQPPAPPYRPSPPPASPGWTPQPAAAGGGSGGRNTWLIAGAIALVAVIGVCVALLATGTLGGGDDEPATTEVTRTETSEDPTTTDEPTTTTEPPTETPAPTEFAPFRSEAADFEADMPTGDGWSEPEVSTISDGLLRTQLSGPDGLEVIIDHTPNEAATFKPADRCKQTSLPTVPYAAKCVFRGGTLAPCRRSRCVDYLMNAGVDGPGWGVLVGGGSNFAETERIAKRIATTLTPEGG
jgi:serine/threonine protein kinase